MVNGNSVENGNPFCCQSICKVATWSKIDCDKSHAVVKVSEIGYSKVCGEEMLSDRLGVAWYLIG